jgi:nucleoside-diphosphate-sugar epimerase
MAEVEIRAAHNVLEACAQTDTIEKVVFTSSVTAVIWRDGRNTMSSDFDERHWSDINLCKKYKVPNMHVTSIYEYKRIRIPSNFLL